MIRRFLQAVGRLFAPARPKDDQEPRRAAIAGLQRAIDAVTPGMVVQVTDRGPGERVQVDVRRLTGIAMMSVWCRGESPEAIAADTPATAAQAQALGESLFHADMLVRARLAHRTAG